MPWRLGVQAIEERNEEGNMKYLVSGMIGVAVLVALMMPLKTFSQAPAPESTNCLYCSCNGKVYENATDCSAECPVTLGCFTGICTPISIPGRPANADPSDGTAWQEKNSGEMYSEKEAQSMIFPNLKCFGVLAERDDSYNCIASTTGHNVPIWWEVDEYYGNNDGVVSVEDFDNFYHYGGYYVSDDCQVEDGKHKIALYGEEQSDGTFEPTHAASQSEFQGPGGNWWESKEGKQKKALHKLEDIGGKSGEGYGEVIKCYEIAR
jgi:hypothetical protein